MTLITDKITKKRKIGFSITFLGIGLLTILMESYALGSLGWLIAWVFAMMVLEQERGTKE